MIKANFIKIFFCVICIFWGVIVVFFGDSWKAGDTKEIEKKVESAELVRYREIEEKTIFADLFPNSDG